MFVPIAGKLVSSIISKKILHNSPKVIEMGNQTYSVDKNILREIIKELNTQDLKEYNINLPILSGLLDKPVGKKAGDTEAPLVSDFYKAIGFSDYSSIDLNDKFGSLIMDLNKDLLVSYGFKKDYDLVTNIGVSEHIFDQATFFKNAHRLAKQDGLMLHILPFVGYVNHGFYNYQPRFFEDLARSNKYELVEFFASDRRSKLLDLKKWSELGAFFYPYLHLLPNTSTGNMFVVALLRKTQDDEFIFPLQGKYMKDINSTQFAESYKRQSGEIYRVVPTRGLFLPNIENRPRSFFTKTRTWVKRLLLKALDKMSKFILLRL